MRCDWHILLRKLHWKNSLIYTALIRIHFMMDGGCKNIWRRFVDSTHPLSCHPWIFRTGCIITTSCSFGKSHGRGYLFCIFRLQKGWSINIKCYHHCENYQVPMVCGNVNIVVYGKYNSVVQPALLTSSWVWWRPLWVARKVRGGNCWVWWDPLWVTWKVMGRNCWLCPGHQDCPCWNVRMIWDSTHKDASLDYVYL